MNTTRIATVVGTATTRLVNGIYHASVVNTNDPLGTNRVQLKIPQVLGTASSNWAVPVGVSGNPSVGQIVFASFIGGDINRPVYMSKGIDAAGSSSALTTGQLFMTGGGTITGTTIGNVISSGYTGLFLDARYSWDMTGLAVKDISNFTIESRMQGSVGWSANVSSTTGRMTTSSVVSADGVQIYSDGTAETQGVSFRDCSFVGSNSNAVVHYGGRQRKCYMNNCFIQNTSSSTGAYALIVDTALSANNSEDQKFGNLSLSGAYAALGIDIGSTTQHANDTSWYDISTASTGPYSIVAAAGGQHMFYNWYDRSSPSTVQVWNQGAALFFYGGEHLNNNASGALHQVDATAATICTDLALTASAGQTVATVAGKFVLRGRVKLNGTGVINLTASGAKVDLSDFALSGTNNLTITGTTGTVYLQNSYIDGGSPTISGFTGTLVFVGNPGGFTTLAPSNGYTNSGAGPSLQFQQVGNELAIVGDLTAPSSSPNVVIATLPTGVNIIHTQYLQVFDRTAGSYGTSNVHVQGSPGVITASGVTASHELAISGKVYAGA